MRTTPHTLAASLAILLATGAMSGCATSQTTAEAAPAAKAEAPVQKQTYFLVYHENGRIYAMTEPGIYLGLMEHDEVPLTRARIGGGPEGETVIYALNKQTKDAGRPMALIEQFKALRQVK